MINHRETSLSKLVSLRAKRSNLFRVEKIASSSLRSAPPRNDTKYNKTGSILIMVLWILVFLSVLAVSLGVKVRQRIILMNRLESRDKLQLIAESGIRKAIVLLNQDIEQSEAQFTSEAKAVRFNNEKEFASMNLRDGTVAVSYEYSDGPGYLAVKRFGVVDEESKINVNKAPEMVLRSLIKTVLGADEPQGHDLAQAIVDWRKVTEGELKGFYSDSYYDNLQDPYPPKKADFEIIDELLLVKVFDAPRFKRLSPYLTVYGEGRVNINTASRPVLIALGMEGELADKVLFARRGEDGIESTMDDYVFQKTDNIVNELKGFVDLSHSQAAAMDQLNQEGKLDTNSRYYSIRAEGKLNNPAS